MSDTLSMIRNRLPGLRSRVGSSGHDSTVRSALVEVFERREIAGWVATEPGTGALRVELCVNEVPVAQTWAAPGTGRRVDGELLQFRFGLSDLWNFTKRDDRVSIRIDDQPLPIMKKGMFYRPRKDGAESLRDLRKRLASGYVFGQSGRLQLSKALDTEWQTAVIGLYQRINAVLVSEFDVKAFLCYGSLLGAVRDNGFIGHDLDFDCAYIAKSQTGKGAAESLGQIAFALIDRGFNVVPKYSCIAVKDDPSDTVDVDIFHLYQDESGQLNFPFGIAGQPSASDGGFDDIRTFDLAGHEVLIPGNPERMVELIYGANWRTPNPGFKWQNDRTVRPREGIITIEQIDEVARANIAPSQEGRTNTLREVLNVNSHLPDVVVDIGSSLGDHSVEIWKSGKHVFGLERTSMSVKRAEALTEAHGITDKLEFRTAEINDPSQLAAAVNEIRQSVDNANIMFYVRSFLHFSDRALRSVVHSLDICGQAGDYLIADFRAASADRWPKDKSRDPKKPWTSSDLIDELTTRVDWSVTDSKLSVINDDNETEGCEGQVVARRG